MALYPAFFIGHGNPMNALETNEYSLEWEQLSAKLPRPKSILCISAHWTTEEPLITAMDEPRTIHDFYGFPDELSQVQYPSPENPMLAQEICKHTHNKIRPDVRWGIDHGSWSILKWMFPEADIPVIQLSISNHLTPKEHFELGEKLKYLRTQNIMVLGSGNIVHNLGLIKWADEAFPWAEEFDKLVKQKISVRDYAALINYEKLPQANLSIPTVEHYLPMLYILAMANPHSNISFFCEEVTMGAISMTSFIVDN
jgi:4,5-DOPA dioxygenase extradiol